MLTLKPRKVTLVDGSERQVWYVKGTCPFTRQLIRVSTRCHRKGDAEAFLIQFERQRRDGARDGSFGRATFGEAIVGYLSKGGEARFLHPLNDEFGNTMLRDIEDTDLSRGAAKLYPNTSAATLVRQFYRPFQSVWRAAVRAKMAPPREFAKPKIKKKSVKIPTDDWLISLLRAMTSINQRAVTLFMAFSGARASEAISVKVKHYNRHTGRIEIEHTKNDDPRNVLLPPFVREVIDLMPVNIQRLRCLATRAAGR